MKAYKGFNEDMTCRDYQYEEGKEYHEDEAELCEKGFHGDGYSTLNDGNYSMLNGGNYSMINGEFVKCKNQNIN